MSKHEHAGLIARLARTYRLSHSVENELERMAQQGANDADLAARAMQTLKPDPNRPPKQQHFAPPASYRLNDAPEVPWSDDEPPRDGFATRGNREVPLPELQ